MKVSRMIGAIQFERCVDVVPAIKGLPGQPTKLHADKRNDYQRCRAPLKQ